LKNRNWDAAQKIAQDLETAGKPEPTAKTIEEATEAFVRDAEARGLRPPSVYKYKLLFKQLRRSPRTKDCGTSPSATSKYSAPSANRGEQEL
jgi:hypothetical protein